MAKKKNSAAVELGRLGGKKRVKKGFGTLTEKERSEKASEGANARWEKWRAEKNTEKRR